MRNKNNHIIGRRDINASERLGMFSWRRWHLPSILKEINSKNGEAKTWIKSWKNIQQIYGSWLRWLQV